jgi:O-antigen/teichoic acid export membrane protein
MDQPDFSARLRDRIYLKNIILSSFSQGGTILATYLTVPLALGYLDPASYGLWLVISSVFSWLNNLDLGLGNGLRNKLAESLTRKDIPLSKQYVSTTYFFIFLISLITLFAILLIDQLVNWADLLNAPQFMQTEFNRAFLLCAVFFSVRFVCNLIMSVLRADQQVGLTRVFGFFSNVLVLISIYLVRTFTLPSFWYLCLAMILPQVLSLILLNLFLFRSRYRSISPSPSAIKLELGREVSELGIKFFILQVIIVIVFATDNVIITKLFGPHEVTPYNIAMKYMKIGAYLLNIVLAPAWSAFTEANILNDLKWIKRTLRRLMFLWFFSLFVLLILLFISGFVYSVWIGDQVIIPFSMTLLMAIFVAQSAWNSIFANYINGVGKISLLLRINIVVGLGNIPLSIFLARNMGMGPEGVIIATLFCMLLGSMFAPIQTWLLVNGKAKGIWNR